MTTPITLTAADLDRLAKDYDDNVRVGGPSPIIINGKLIPADAFGAWFRKTVERGLVPELVEGGELPPWILGWGGDDAELPANDYAAGIALWQIVGIWHFQKQQKAYQREHQVSGLIEVAFEFTPLGFSTTWPKQAHWLGLIGDDGAKLRAAAQRLGREFLALADGPGAHWVRCRELWLKEKDGTEGWRCVRDSWSTLAAALEDARHVEFSSGLKLDDTADELALELEIWEEGDCKSYLLVHPDLAHQLDGPEQWWV